MHRQHTFLQFMTYPYFSFLVLFGIPTFNIFRNDLFTNFILLFSVIKLFLCKQF